ncbi:MAG: biopolymer transporter ExbD [Planctomycetota bacterium]|jgi:biopolymer transport protein ExbD|nr:biopolymer transporter ExbD [Planctomycetota bacterium]
MRGMEDDEVYEIPLTSLVDVVFLLLIFFLVATNFNQKEKDHAVLLPESEAGEKVAPVPDRLVINIRENSLLVVNGQVVTDTELRFLAQTFARANPERAAVIRADGRVPYQAVMRVFGICRTAGVRNVDLPILEPAAS